MLECELSMYLIFIYFFYFKCDVYGSCYVWGFVIFNFFNDLNRDFIKIIKLLELSDVFFYIF